MQRQAKEDGERKDRAEDSFPFLLLLVSTLDSSLIIPVF